MVDNVSEKVDECPLSIVYWEPENCPLYRVVGCLLFMGCLKLRVPVDQKSNLISMNKGSCMLI